MAACHWKLLTVQLNLFVEFSHFLISGIFFHYACEIKKNHIMYIVVLSDGCMSFETVRCAIEPFELRWLTQAVMNEI